jgi:hypothetical protein
MTSVSEVRHQLRQVAAGGSSADWVIQIECWHLLVYFSKLLWGVDISIEVVDCHWSSSLMWIMNEMYVNCWKNMKTGLVQIVSREIPWGSSASPRTVRTKPRTMWVKTFSLHFLAVWCHYTAHRRWNGNLQEPLIV